MSLSIQRLLARANKMGWKLEKLKDKEYMVWKTIDDVDCNINCFETLKDVANFLSKQPKKEPHYRKNFTETSVLTKRLGYKLFKEDYWDAMGIRFSYRISNGQNDKRFKTLIEIERWYKENVK